MADNQVYLAIGEEATRGTAESTTVGFVPLLSAATPKMEFNDKKRKEFRGENTAKGDTTVNRMDQKWSYSLPMPFYTESGSAKGLVGALLKHFFGKVSSSQNGATGQYRHMFSYEPAMFEAANLGTKALTLNSNQTEGSAVKNHPYKGGRVKSLSFEQTAGEPLTCTIEMMGQSKNAAGTAIASPVFAAENLRCDFNNLTVYTGGSPTRTGTAPDYTEVGAGAAVAFKPDKISLKIEDGREDALRLSGVDYPDKTRLGQIKVSLEFTIDWEDPASGFSAVDDRNAYLAGISETNIMLIWNTGTQAGTGDNHGLIIDIPRANRLGGDPDFNSDKGPMITLKYEGLMDTTTTQYAIGMMLKNTASAV